MLMSEIFEAELKGEAQAEVVVRVVGVPVVPVRHTAVPGVVVPAAATVHAVRALAEASHAVACQPCGIPCFRLYR